MMFCCYSIVWTKPRLGRGPNMPKTRGRGGYLNYFGVWTGSHDSSPGIKQEIPEA